MQELTNKLKFLRALQMVDVSLVRVTGFKLRGKGAIVAGSVPASSGGRRRASSGKTEESFVGTPDTPY